MTYTDLIFDLYGTLVDIHTEEDDSVWEKTALYFSFHGAHYSGSELKEAFTASMRKRESEAGQSYECFPDIPFEEVLTQLFIAKGIKKNADALAFNAAQLFRILSIEYIKLYPDVCDTLSLLRKCGCRLWLLSNAQRAFTEYELRHLGLEEYFNGTYISSDYGCRKPDRRFFDALIEERRLERNNCIMIGNDRNTDIAGATAAGLATLYIHTNLTPADQAQADLARLPQNAPAGCRNFEYEGSNWIELAQILEKL